MQPCDAKLKLDTLARYSVISAIICKIHWRFKKKKKVPVK